MSLFYAEATPMLKLISRYATQCHMVDAMVPMDVTSECLAAMAHICRGLLVKPSLRSRVTRDDTLMLLLRVMTGVIILYDHIDPYGVFRKASKLDVKSCVRLLKEQNPKNVQCLLNAIKYSTLHFTDETTPRVIKQLLASTHAALPLSVTHCGFFEYIFGLLNSWCSAPRFLQALTQTATNW
ncbi:unnamed protein product [Hymenolepis diminuta]|uniref:CYRIA/CYRIB Rac1 binding domain-containing protein n=1 Tax=Hymenolepis diminuta TaxID=6216 RepID=A0A564YDF6_HYMDI|nr:unnamed protein product [Hymenolepis diminuta]